MSSERKIVEYTVVSANEFPSKLGIEVAKYLDRWRQPLGGVALGRDEDDSSNDEYCQAMVKYK